MRIVKLSVNGFSERPRSSLVPRTLIIVRNFKISISSSLSSCSARSLPGRLPFLRRELWLHPLRLTWMRQKARCAPLGLATRVLSSRYATQQTEKWPRPPLPVRSPADYYQVSVGLQISRALAFPVSRTIVPYSFFRPEIVIN